MFASLFFFLVLLGVIVLEIRDNIYKDDENRDSVDFKAWNNFIRINDQFKYEGVFNADGTDRYEFSLNDKWGNERYRASVWPDGYCTIHHNGNVVLGIGNEKMRERSKFMAELLNGVRLIQDKI